MYCLYHIPAYMRKIYHTPHIFPGSSLIRWKMKFNSPFPLTNAVFTYSYDGMQRLVMIVPKIGNAQLMPMEYSTNMTTGRKEQIGPFRCYERFHNESIISDGVASVTRQMDPLYRLKFLSIVISDKEVGFDTRLLVNTYYILIMGCKIYISNTVIWA